MIVQRIHQLQSELALENNQVIVSATEFNGGSSKNITPDFVSIGGTLRSPTITSMDLAKQRLIDVINQTTASHRAHADIKIIDYYPPTINSVEETQHVFNVARRLLGNQRVSIKPKPSRSSEDFSFYLEKIPGCYFLLGNGEDTPPCHNSTYNFNDALLSDAAELLCHIAIDYLNK